VARSSAAARKFKRRATAWNERKPPTGKGRFRHGAAARDAAKTTGFKIDAIFESFLIFHNASLVTIDITLASIKLDQFINPGNSFR
jgi:hypothetical protein